MSGASISAAEKPASGESAKEHQGVILFSADGPQRDHYWIGLDVNPLSAEQRKELHVDDDQGLLIGEVTPDSPAAKAGLEAHDILLKAGKKPLKQIADLAGAIQETKDQALQLEVKRDGKLQSIGVTPAKRSAGGLTFRLVDPEIRLNMSGAGESERSGSDDATVRERIALLLSTRHELQQRVKALNEKLGSLSNKHDGGAADALRGQMHDAEEQIEAINRQAVMLETSRGNPGREKLTRQLATLRQCAADLAEVGRTEEASHLGSAAHEIEEQLQAIDQASRQLRTQGMIQISNPSMARAVVQADPDQMRLRQIQTAIQLLGQNGMPEEAERIRQKADAIAREQQQRRERSAGRVAPQPPDPAIDGLRGQVEEMRRELRELREAVGRMSQRND